MTTLIDGGYLSWSYGVSPERQEYWKTNCSMYHWKTTGHLFVMDSVAQGHRIEFDPTYKLRRREKREADPEWLERTASVHQFRNEVLYQDNNLSLVKCEGFEADDLLAVLADRLKKPVKIVGVDKDLLQLGDQVEIRRLDGTLVEISGFAGRLPVGLGRFLRTPLHILLTLSIFGDKSDGIPKLLAPRQLGPLREIYNHAKPFTRAYELFGQAFIHNLYLTILPGPWCFDPLPSPEQVYNLARSGRYPGNLQLNPRIQKVLDDVLELDRQTGHLLAIESNEEDW
jgi:hypothetical protein